MVTQSLICVSDSIFDKAPANGDETLLLLYH
jgi:hypothetical protein